MDIPSDGVFDRLTALASELTGSPVALVSLVDEERQFFASQIGLEQPWATRRETPVESSFCGIVVEQGQPLVVSDSLRDRRVRDNPAVKLLGITAYAGYPIVVEGEVLGSFCAIRSEAHEWSQLELKVIRELAESVSNEIELRLELERRKLAQEALESSNRDLDNFVKMVAHDLKEPLRGVRSCLQVGMARLPELEEQTAELFRLAGDSALRMSEMIDSLRAYGSLEVEPGPHVEVDLDTTLREVMSDLSQALGDCDATLVVRGPLGAVKGDEVQLRRLFQNLLENALKFVSPGVRPYIEVSKKNGTFRIKDNGIGIRPEHREEVFQVFRRLHSRRDYPGSGMGLSVCRRIVESHGGVIWIESEEGEGTRVFFELN